MKLFWAFLHLNTWIQVRCRLLWDDLSSTLASKIINLTFCSYYYKTNTQLYWETYLPSLCSNCDQPESHRLKEMAAKSPATFNKIRKKKTKWTDSAVVVYVHLNINEGEGSFFDNLSSNPRNVGPIVNYRFVRFHKLVKNHLTPLKQSNSNLITPSQKDTCKSID